MISQREKVNKNHGTPEAKASGVFYSVWDQSLGLSKEVDYFIMYWKRCPVSRSTSQIQKTLEKMSKRNGPASQTGKMEAVMSGMEDTA